MQLFVAHEANVCRTIKKPGASAPETSHVTASCGMFFACKTAWICLQPFIYFLTMKCQLLCPMLHRHYKIFSLIYRTFSLRWCHGITCSDLMTFFYLNSCDNSNVTFSLYIEFARAEETDLFLDQIQIMSYYRVNYFIPLKLWCICFKQ